MTRILPEQRSEGLAVNRRHALGAFAALAGGLAAGGAVAATGVPPVPSAVAELIDDWKTVSAAYLAAAERQNEIESRHPDLRDEWPGAYSGLSGSFHRFPLGIDAEFEDQRGRLILAFGRCPDVERAIKALDKLRLAARANLDAAWAAYKTELEACGLAAAEREANDAARAEYEAFAAILAYQPASAEEDALRSTFLLEFVVRWPADPKVSDIREALFSSSRGATVCG